MIAETLCFVSSPKRLDDWKYSSLFVRPGHQSAVFSRPSSKVVLGCHPILCRTSVMLAYQSVTSHWRLGMEKLGASRMEKIFRASSAHSPIVVLCPVPMLNEAP